MLHLPGEQYERIPVALWSTETPLVSIINSIYIGWRHLAMHCKSQFSHHNTPDRLILTKGHNSLVTVSQITHLITKPWVHNYPWSNIMVEQAIQTVKNFLKKAILDKRDPGCTVGIQKHTNIWYLRIHALPSIRHRTKPLLPVSNKLLQPKAKTVQGELTKRTELLLWSLSMNFWKEIKWWWKEETGGNQQQKSTLGMASYKSWNRNWKQNEIGRSSQ